MRLLAKWLVKLRAALTGEESKGGKAGPDSAFQWIYEPRLEVDGDRYTLVSSPGPPATQAHVGSRRYTSHSSDASSSIAGVAESPSAPLEGEGVTRVSSVPALYARGPGRYEAVPPEPYLRKRLDMALNHWQTAGELPPASLLLEGLAALDAGVCFSSDQSSLLLTAAFYYKRGMLTALRHQDDPERTGLIAAEALTTPEHPLSPETISALQAEDPRADAWRGPLLSELRVAASGVDMRARRLAIDALWHLEMRPRSESERGEPRSVRTWVRVSFVVVAAAVAGLILWFTLRSLTSSSTAYLPAGTYSVLMDGGERQLIATDGFGIDRYEVNNRAYRNCVQSNGCTPPVAVAVSGISDYYHDVAYDLHPVVNVSWEQAEDYCRRRNMDLPTAEEWMLAAGAAPATGTLLAFPWGNTFDSHRANTLDTQLLRPAETGSFSPAGDSPIGASDMAGNVAEWTSSTRDDGATYVVKGASFRDGSDFAHLYTERTGTPDSFADWLGFRCVTRKANR